VTFSSVKVSLREIFETNSKQQPAENLSRRILNSNVQAGTENCLRVQRVRSKHLVALIYTSDNGAVFTLHFPRVFDSDRLIVTRAASLRYRDSQELARDIRDMW
jgi:hypothetical protein